MRREPGKNVGTDTEETEENEETSNSLNFCTVLNIGFSSETEETKKKKKRDSTNSFQFLSSPTEGELEPYSSDTSKILHAQKMASCHKYLNTVALIPSQVSFCREPPTLNVQIRVGNNLGQNC